MKNAKKYLHIDGAITSKEGGARIIYALDDVAIAPIKKLIKQGRGIVQHPAEWAAARYRNEGGKGCHPIN